MVFASKIGEQKDGEWIRVMIWCFVLAILTGFVLFLTIRRVNREKKTENTYQQLRKLKENYGVDLPEEFVNN